jgi:hypothetical protein
VNTPGPNLPDIGKKDVLTWENSKSSTTVTETKQYGDDPNKATVITTTKKTEKKTWRIEPSDVIAIASAIVAIMFAGAMIAGWVPITKGTLGVVTFAAIPTVIFGVRQRRKKNKKTSGQDPSQE